MPIAVGKLVDGKHQFAFGGAPLFEARGEGGGFDAGGGGGGEREVVDCEGWVGGDAPAVAVGVGG